ncbi:MAG: DUF1573 domain-containing protein [Bacteroidales bacterium]
MKKFAFLFCILVLSTTMLYGQSGPKFEYLEKSVDLGAMAIETLEMVKIEVEFENKGDQPLVVSQVRGCCGTRIMEWTREPVLPGEKGKIIAQFRPAARVHNINRVITAMSNDESGQKVFKIYGKVVENTEAFKPENPAKKAMAPTVK